MLTKQELLFLATLTSNCPGLLLDISNSIASKLAYCEKVFGFLSRANWKKHRLGLSEKEGAIRQMSRWLLAVARWAPGRRNRREINVGHY